MLEPSWCKPIGTLASGDDKHDSTFDDAEGLEDVLADLRGRPQKGAAQPERPAAHDLEEFEDAPPSATFASAEGLLPIKRKVDVRVEVAQPPASSPSSLLPGPLPSNEFIPIESERGAPSPKGKFRGIFVTGEAILFDEPGPTIIRTPSEAPGADSPDSELLDDDDLEDAELDDADLEEADVEDADLEEADNDLAVDSDALPANVVPMRRAKANITAPPSRDALASVPEYQDSVRPSYGTSKEPTGETVMSVPGPMLAAMIGSRAKPQEAASSDDFADEATRAGIPLADMASKLPAAPRLSELETSERDNLAPEAAEDAAEEAASAEGASAWDDAKEAVLIKSQNYSALADMYYAHMFSLSDAEEAARFANKAGLVCAEQLSDEARAIEAFTWAIQADPFFDEPQMQLEKLIAKAGTQARAKWTQPLQRVTRSADDAESDEIRACYYAVLARWYLVELKRRDLGGDFLAKLERLDPGHPLVLERKANEARAASDVNAQAQYLSTALERVTRPTDRSKIYLELGELYDSSFDSPETAAQYYEAAHELDPSNLRILRSLARIAKTRGDDEALLRYTQTEHDLTPKGRAKTELALSAAELQLGFGQPTLAKRLVEGVLAEEPQHPKALLLAERALLEGGGDPNELAALYRSKILKAKSPRAKTEAMLALVELLELKLEDQRAAYEVMSDLARAEPRNKRYAQEQERIAKDLGRHGDALGHSVTVAELTTDPKEAAGLFVVAGDYAIDVLAEAAGARALYLRALERDKRCILAMERIESVEIRLGNPREALIWFEKRAQSTEDKVLRAELLLDVSMRKYQAGDDAPALASLEAARSADPDNEDVAGALLERYAEIGRYDAGWPIFAELAKRMRAYPPDPEVQLARYRLGTRIAAARNMKEAALECALLGFRALPDSPVAQDDLVSVAAKIDVAVAKNARMELVQLSASPHDLNPGRIVQLGHVLLRIGEARAAFDVVEYVERHGELNAQTLGLREAVLTLQQNWEALAQTKIDIARLLAPDLAYAKLVEAGDLFARELNQPALALPAFEMARDIKPHDPWILETLAWVYGEVRDVGRQLEQLNLLLAREPDVSKKVLLLEEIAEKLNGSQDPSAAAKVLDDVLALDPTRLSAFDRQVKLLREAYAYKELEVAYLNMAKRVAEKPQLLAALYKQLGILRRDKLDDKPGAREAFTTSLTHGPKDDELRTMLLDIVQTAGDDAATVELLSASVLVDPFRPELYAKLFEIHARTEAYDRAWCALDVLAQLTPLEGEQLAYYEDYPPVRLDKFPGTLTEDAWKSHLMHPDMDPLLTALASWLGPIALRLKQSATLAQLTPFTPNDSPHADVVLAAFENACEILSIALPAICATRTGSKDAPFRTSMVPAPKVEIYGPSIEESLETMVYFIGRTLASMRPELVTAFHFETKDELAGLLARALSGDPSLWTSMTLSESNVVRDLTKRAQDDGAKFDAKRWLILAKSSADRAALLLCGSAHEAAVHYAKVGGAKQSGDPYAREKLGLLYAFAISREHGELRQALGTAVGSEPDKG
jgi:tetratricopeptide (TPR) repeat protein